MIATSAATYAATTIGVTTAITMTTIQKILVGSTITAILGTAVHQTQRASRFKAQIQAIEQQQGERLRQVRCAFGWEEPLSRSADANKGRWTARKSSVQNLDHALQRNGSDEIRLDSADQSGTIAKA
jgi:hypothetical protein